MFPLIGLPPSVLINQTGQKTFWPTSIELGVKDIIKHHFLHCWIKLKPMEYTCFKPQILHTDGIDTIEEHFYMEYLQLFHKPLPIDFFCMLFHKEGPVKNLPQRNICANKVGSQMLY